MKLQMDIEKQTRQYGFRYVVTQHTLANADLLYSDPEAKIWRLPMNP